MWTLACIAVICLTGPFIVVDGDGFKANGMALRLWGVAAPELRDDAGPDAKAALAAILAGVDRLACESKGASFSRIVVRCETPEGVDISAAMIATRWAQDWPRFSGETYAAADDALRPEPRP